MRVIFLALLASVPLFSGTIINTSVECNGTAYTGTDYASCGENGITGGATAQAFSASLYVSVSAGAWAGAYPSSTSASVSLSEDFILTVIGGSGNGYAAPELSAGASSWGSPAVSWADASLGGCSVSAYGNGPTADYCSPTSVAFLFGVPQMLTLTESAGAQAGPWEWGTPEVEGSATFQGFSFFDAEGRPLSDVTYTFDPVGQPSNTPEPGTLLLTAIACAALSVRKR